MKELALFLVFLMTFLLACQLQDLPPTPGAPGAAAPIGRATGVFAGYAEPTTLTITPEEIVFVLGDVQRDVEAAITGEQFVYKTGYALDVSTNSWRPVEFREPAVGIVGVAANWIKGDASQTLTVNLSELNIDIDQTRDLYMIAYACTKKETAWDCHQNQWMIKNFKARLTGELPPGPPTPIVVTEPQTLWLTEGEVNKIIKIIDGIEHTIYLVDTTEQGNACQVSVDGVFHWINIAESASWNGVKVAVNDVRAIHAQLRDVDVCQVTIEKGIETTPLPESVLLQGGKITYKISEIQLIDVNEAGDACGLLINNHVYWIKKGTALYGVSGGMAIVVDNVRAVHNQDRMKDQCEIRIKDDTTSPLMLQEIWINEITSAGIINGKTFSLFDVSAKETACGIIVDGILRWLKLGETSSWNGLSFKVNDVKAVHSADQNDDHCLVEIAESMTTTPYVASQWRVQNEIFALLVDGVEHTMEVLDITEAEDACQVKVDNIIAIIYNGETKDIGGVQIGVEDVIGVHTPLQDKDVCKLKLPEAPTPPMCVISPGPGGSTWHTQNCSFTETINGVIHTIEVLDTTEAADACQIKIDDVTAIIDVWTSPSDTKTIQGTEVTVVAVQSPTNTLLTNDQCALKFASPEPTCTDSDGGKNYDVKGIQTVSTYTYEDSCGADGITLEERYCDQFWGATTKEFYLCPNGCSDGACLPAPTPPGCTSDSQCTVGQFCIDTECKAPTYQEFTVGDSWTSSQSSLAITRTVNGQEYAFKFGDPQNVSCYVSVTGPQNEIKTLELNKDTRIAGIFMKLLSAKSSQVCVQESCIRYAFFGGCQEYACSSYQASYSCAAYVG